MNKEDINVGMWLRYVNEGHYSPRAFRVDSFKRRYDGEVGPHGFTPDGVEMNPRHQDCEPWVPRVGEWVRCTRTGSRSKVTGTWRSHCAWWSSEGGTYGRSDECEPCMPPTEKPAGLTKLLPGGVEVPYVPPPKDCDCPRCTGPAMRMLSFECQGKDWRDRLPKEPAWSRLVCIAPTWGPSEIEGDWDADRYEDWSNAHEQVWSVGGLGHSAEHPIRETAIAMWREAVERG